MTIWKKDTTASIKGEKAAKNSHSLVFSQTTEEHEANGERAAERTYATAPKQAEFKAGWMQAWRMRQWVNAQSQPEEE